MSVLINKDTKIYCSFSQNAGNKGCEFFNKAFSDHGINAIYKSFSVKNIFKATESAITLGFSGFAVSMPFKKTIIEILDFIDVSVSQINAVNTVIIRENGRLKGYNTDYYGVLKILTPLQTKYKKIHILGNGGLSAAVQAASIDLGFQIEIITRKDWDKINQLKNSLIYNCTPLKLDLDSSNRYIDCLIGTIDGDLLHKYQSHKQFELYTGIKIDDNV